MHEEDERGDGDDVEAARLDFLGQRPVAKQPVQQASLVAFSRVAC